MYSVVACTGPQNNSAVFIGLQIQIAIELGADGDKLRNAAL
jgi:hypothetical protein